MTERGGEGGSLVRRGDTSSVGARGANEVAERSHSPEVGGEVKQRAGLHSGGGGGVLGESWMLGSPHQPDPQSQFLPHPILPIPQARGQESLPLEPSEGALALQED